MVFAIHWHESATGCTCVPHPEPHSHLPPHPIPLGWVSALTLSALFHASNLDWWSISHMVIYMFQWQVDSLPIEPQGKPLLLHAAAKSLQLCQTVCDPIDGSPPGSLVPGILQAKTLEWVAISFSNAWKWKVKGKSLSRVRLLATPWTAAYQAPPSMGFSRQEYWNGVPLPSPLA